MEDRPVALIGPPIAGTVAVQFLQAEAISSKNGRDDVFREIRFYMLELKEEDPWAYAQYHCSTAANVYAKVQWSYVPANVTTSHHN